MKIEELNELLITNINIKWDVDTYGLATVQLTTYVPVNDEKTRLKFAEILEETKKDVHDWKLKCFIGVDRE